MHFGDGSRYQVWQTAGVGDSRSLSASHWRLKTIVEATTRWVGARARLRMMPRESGPKVVAVAEMSDKWNGVMVSAENISIYFKSFRSTALTGDVFCNVANFLDMGGGFPCCESVELSRSFRAVAATQTPANDSLSLSLISPLLSSPSFDDAIMAAYMERGRSCHVSIFFLPKRFCRIGATPSVVDSMIVLISLSLVDSPLTPSSLL